MCGVEQFFVAQSADGTRALVRGEDPLSESFLMETLLDQLQGVRTLRVVGHKCHLLRRYGIP